MSWTIFLLPLAVFLGALYSLLIVVGLGVWFDNIRGK